jgi:excisionase family DNA binding protein
MRTLLADELADILRVPKGRVYELVRQGKLPAVRIGRQVRFREETVAAWLAELENDSAATQNEMPNSAGYARHRST